MSRIHSNDLSAEVPVEMQTMGRDLADLFRANQTPKQATVHPQTLVRIRSNVVTFKRNAMRLNRTELSRRSGLHCWTLIKIETNRQTHIQFGQITKLARALDIPADDLIAD